MEDAMIKRIGLLTSGGDCQALNATMRGVVKGLSNSVENLEVYGFDDGYKGLIYGKYRMLTARDFSGILTQGGTILGTSRQPFKLMRVPDEKGLDKVEAMKQTYYKLCLDCLVILGGNGTQKTANLLRESRLQQEVAAKIVRFHVRANSDCASDQQIKLQVRDAVAEELQTILHGAETKAETEEILRENEPSIRAAALQTLRAGGSTDDITVTYGKASFEEKETGNYILPAGTYDALQINIGRAKGHNWWCMLYPSICFSDALRPVNEDGESAEKVEKSRIPLQNLLSDAAYREILKSDRISFRFFWR